MRDNLVRPYRVEVQRKESNPSFLIRPKMYVVHDNAANAKLAFKSCSGVTQLFCLNHTLNLVVQDALKSTILGSNVKNLLRKTQKLAVQVKKSPKLTEELKSTCKSLKVKYVSLKKSIVTRWHSKLRNVASVLHLKPVLIHLFGEGESEVWSESEISTNEWKILSGVEQCLEFVKMTSKSFESDTEPTSHLVVRKLFELENWLVKFMTDIVNDR